MAEVEVGGIKFRGGKMVVVLMALSSVGRGACGAVLRSTRIIWI